MQKKKYKVCKNYKNLLMRSGFNDYEWACFASMSSTAHKKKLFTEDIVGPTLLNGFRLYFFILIVRCSSTHTNEMRSRCCCCFLQQ